MRKHLPFYDEEQHYVELQPSRVEGLEETEPPKIKRRHSSNTPSEIDDKLSSIEPNTYLLNKDATLEGALNSIFIVREQEELDVAFIYPSEVCSREIFVIEKGARLSLTSKVFPSNFSYISREFYIYENAEALTKTVGSSKFLELLTVINLEGYQSKGFERTAFILNEQKQARIFSQLNHIAKNTEGDSHVRGIQAGRSTSAVEGMIKIFEGGKGTNSYLNQYVLLMEEALSHTYPSLEIENDEVRASHSASVSTLDEEEVFYLMSRGLGRKEAIKTLVNGFLSNAVDVSASPDFQRMVEEVAT